MWKNKSYLLYLVLSLIAILSAFGLDYIRGKKGEESYLFPSPPTREILIGIDKSIKDTLLKEAESLGISPEAISQYRDNQGMLHLMINLSLSQYEHLESLLVQEFSKIEALTTSKTQKQDEKQKYVLWQVQKKGEQLLSLLFSCQLEILAEKKPPSLPKSQNRFAIIVDDMGYSLDAIYEISSLNTNLTIAILPYSPLGRETAHIAKVSNLEVILHLPLESMNNIYDNNNTEGMIHSGMSGNEIVKSVQEGLAQIPFIAGVNTHMGSKITADANLMRTILEPLKGRNLYFIDSRTTARSVAYDIAQEMGIPSGRRHIFLDSEIQEDFIKAQLLALFQEAKEKGSAIGICHPSPETFKILKQNLNRAGEFGVNPVFASEIVR